MPNTKLGKFTSSQTPKQNSESELIRLINLYLLHSYLYYFLDSSLISDSEYDAIAKKLLMQKKALESLDYPDAKMIIDSIGGEASAFNIKKYPNNIISSALKLLYLSKPQKIDFDQFILKLGYKSL